MWPSSTYKVLNRTDFKKKEKRKKTTSCAFVVGFLHSTFCFCSDLLLLKESFATKSSPLSLFFFLMLQLGTTLSCTTISVPSVTPKYESSFMSSSRSSGSSMPYCDNGHTTSDTQYWNRIEILNGWRIPLRDRRSNVHFLSSWIRMPVDGRHEIDVGTWSWVPARSYRLERSWWW